MPLCLSSSEAIADPRRACVPLDLSWPRSGNVVWGSSVFRRFTCVSKPSWQTFDLIQTLGSWGKTIKTLTYNLWGQAQPEEGWGFLKWSLKPPRMISEATLEWMSSRNGRESASPSIAGNPAVSFVGREDGCVYSRFHTCPPPFRIDSHLMLYMQTSMSFRHQGAEHGRV